MYDRIVDVPRLVASLPEDGPGHPLVTEMTATLSAHYGRALLPASLAAYRKGVADPYWLGNLILSPKTVAK